MFRFCVTIGLILAASVCVSSYSTQQAIQTVTATRDGAKLPPSTGQVTDLTNCERIVARNLAAAPILGYTVHGGSFTDPSTHITVTQGCLSDPRTYDPAPIHPFNVTAPELVQRACPQVGPSTDIWFIFGQSNAGNFGEGRHTAKRYSYAYGGNGACFELSDPVAGGQGTDAGPWARLADKMYGAPGTGGTAITKIVVIERAIGGSSVRDWAPGGSQNAYLLSQLQDAIAHGVVPTRLFWIQGEADSGRMDAITWARYFMGMLHSVRAISVTAPIYVAMTTICNERDSANYPATDVLNRPADWFIWSEAGRLQIRQAQARVVDGVTVRAGPNLDAIDVARRRDGCHFGPLGLDDHAEAWFQILSGGG